MEHPDSEDSVFIMAQLIGTRVKAINKKTLEVFVGRLHNIDIEDPECLVFVIAPEPEVERQFMIRVVPTYWDITPLP